jgi:hypothetical protein
MRRVVLLLGALVACDRPPAIPNYCSDEHAFTGALVACVEVSVSREESRACRKAVELRCGITETDSAGGAP